MGQDTGTGTRQDTDMDMGTRQDTDTDMGTGQDMDMGMGTGQRFPKQNTAVREMHRGDTQ